MQELNLTDDAGFAAFQFYWYALQYRWRDGETPERLRREYELKLRMTEISEGRADGGRTLREPTWFRVSDDERFTLLNALTETSWVPSVFPQVVFAIRLLGYQTQVSLVPQRTLTPSLER